ncbi:MAG TPA: serpin family protein [Gemmatimonadales bacterium]|jgi:serpin B|nr:serpin family protein [Gemmatimonadales bacterium]
MMISFQTLLPLMLVAAQSPAPADTTPGYLQFGFELLRRRVGATPAENISTSPVSAGFALSAAALGARGRTQKQMLGVLGFEGSTPDEVGQRNKGWIAALHHPQDVQLEIANAVWVDSEFALDSAYAHRVAELFQADVATAALRTADGVADVNNWVARHTHNRIERIIDEPRSNTAAFIANATYFKGTWLKEFAKEATKSKPFYQSPGSSRNVPTMHAKLSARYARAERVQLARLPYRGGRFEMVIALPDPGVEVSSVAKELSDTLWQSWLAQSKATELELALPRFKLETSMSLKSDLAALGITDAFDPTLADLSGMFASGTPGTFLSEVIQKTWIAVDEEGTEAAAATGVTVGVTSARIGRPVSFVVNRPFIYALRDAKTGLVLFLGIVRSPQ